MATPIPVNRCVFAFDEIARATRGTWVGVSSEGTVTGVSTDTRNLEPGSLFVALSGSNHDGHAHLAAAKARGATAAIVRRGTKADMPVCEVDDTLVALGELARLHRERMRVPSIAITGSAGKTTTKELTAALARALFGEVLVTAGNLNNLVGVPMTLLTLERRHAAMVIECGTNARGEIARLGEIVGPDVGVVLNADVGHTEGLGTLTDVAVEKAGMFRAARRVAVGNADDPPSFAHLGDAARAKLTFGESAGADFRLLAHRVERDGASVLRVGVPVRYGLPDGEPFEARIGLLGRAAALDAVAALAAVYALADRVITREERGRMAASLAAVKPAAGRLVPMRTAGVLIIDDTYNANPRSVRSSIAAAREVADQMNARLLLVLGDMLELGALSAEMHARVGEAVLDARAAGFVAVGEQMAVAARVVAAAGDRGMLAIEAARTGDAHAILAALLRPGDVVLVKGSRGMRMETIVEALAGQTATVHP